MAQAQGHRAAQAKAKKEREKTKKAFQEALRFSLYTHPVATMYTEIAPRSCSHRRTQTHTE